MRYGPIIAGIVFLFTAPSWAQPVTGFSFGPDFALPYTLRVAGTSAKARGNFNFGFDGRYQWEENLSAGMRLFMDLETRQGSFRRVGVMPGIQYRWLPGERFNPFIRLDLPVVFRGPPTPPDQRPNRISVSPPAAA